MAGYSFNGRLFAFCLILLLSQVVSAQALTPGEQVLNEARRLEARVNSLSLSENETKLYTDGLKRVQVTARNDRVLLSLYFLQPLQLAVMTNDYHKAKADIIKKGTEAFESEWKSLGEQLNLKEQRFKSQAAPFTAAVLALAEASLTQVHPYYQSGRLYALNRSVDEGMFYLGRAPASLEFALFCQQLRFDKPRARLKLRSITVELNALETETLAAYEKSENKDLRPFISTNVTMKMAADLNREQRYFGALLKYLDATLFLHLLNAVPPNTAQQDELRKQQEVFDKRLTSGKTDHSIGLIYWQMSQRALHPSAEDTIGPEELKRATVIITEVLPRYFKITTL